MTQADKPDHPAFEDLSLGFKDNTAAIRIHYGRTYLVLHKKSANEGCKLTREEWFNIEKNWFEICKYFHNKNLDNDRLWIQVRDSTSNPIYITISSFLRKTYVDIRDYYYPYTKDDGLLPTSRGVILDEIGWQRLGNLFDEINEKWLQAERFLTALDVNN